MHTSSPESQDEGKTSKQRKNREWKPWGKACYKLFSLAAALQARRQRMRERAAQEVGSDRAVKAFTCHTEHVGFIL